MSLLTSRIGAEESSGRRRALFPFDSDIRVVGTAPSNTRFMLTRSLSFFAEFISIARLLGNSVDSISKPKGSMELCFPPSLWFSRLRVSCTGRSMEL